MIFQDSGEFTTPAERFRRVHGIVHTGNKPHSYEALTAENEAHSPEPLSDRAMLRPAYALPAFA
jgi:hypothetical protein